jgi:chromosome segregation ATPase
MKNLLPTALVLLCIVLAVSLVVLKRGGDAQHESDAGAIADFSNRLDSANLQIATCNGTIFTFSNSLDESRASALTFSNQMVEAQSALALDAEQITNLNQRAAAAESENQILGRRVVELNSQMTNQVAALTRQTTSTQARLDQANKDYALLENRFRIDVAERVVAERKFNDLPALQAQILNLKENPFAVVTPESIYAGLDVEVKTNGSFHVITPN